MSNEMVPETNGKAELRPAAVPEPRPELFGDAAPRQPPAARPRYLAAIGRYRWLVVGFALLGTAVSAVATRFVHPKYVANATIWVEAPPRPNDRSGPIQTAGLLVSSAWLDLLHSYKVMDYVVRDQRLYLDYDPGDARLLSGFRVAGRYHPGVYDLQVAADGRSYTLTAADGSIRQSGTPGDSVGLQAGFLWAPPAAQLRPGRDLRFTLATPRDAARKLNQDLNAAMPKDGNFLSVGLQGEDPARIAGVVNALVDRFVAVAAELKAAKMTEVARILGTQVQIAQNNLHNAESALENYRVHTVTLPTDEALMPSVGTRSGTLTAGGTGTGTGTSGDLAFSSYFAVKVQRDQIQRDISAIRAALKAGPGGTAAVDALAVIGAVQQSPEMTQVLQELTAKRAALRALKQQYTDAYLPVKRAQEDLDSLQQETVPRLAANLISALRLRTTELDSTATVASQELRAIPPRLIDEARLQRQVAVSEQLYNNVQSRYDEARLAAETAVPDVRVLDRAAIPREPDHDPRIKLLLMGMLGSIGMGLALALVLDRFDPHVRYPDEVTTHMGLPILGVLPQIQLQDGAMDREEVNQVLEALRTIRLNLLHAYGAAGPVVVTVSSPGSGEGKSFLISNLALAFADQGYRTLAIDGDTRRGTVHRLLKTERKPGLTDHLTGAVDLQAVLRHTPHAKLDCIPSGTRLQNGPELLASAAMHQLMTRLRAAYDVILLDSPPLAAGVDPFVLATVSGHLLLVIRTGRTERALAHAHLDNLSRISTRVLGVVLNGIQEPSVYRYYRYLPGYDAGGEESGEAQQLLPAG